LRRPIVDALSAQGRPGLAEVDAYLVRPPGFKATLNQGVLSERFHHADMRHRPLPHSRLGRAAAPAVAAVADQIRLNPPRLGPAANHGQVAPLDRVRPKLPAQARLGFAAEGEDDESTGLFIQPVDRAD